MLLGWYYIFNTIFKMISNTFYIIYHLIIFITNKKRFLSIRYYELLFYIIYSVIKYHYPRIDHWISRSMSSPQHEEFLVARRSFATLHRKHLLVFIAKPSTQFTLPLLHLRTPRQGVFSLISAFLASPARLKNVLKNQNRNAFIALIRLHHLSMLSSFFLSDIVLLEM